MKNWLKFLAFWRPPFERWMAAFYILKLEEDLPVMTVLGYTGDGVKLKYAVFADSPATMNELMEKLEDE